MKKLYIIKNKIKYNVKIKLKLISIEFRYHKKQLSSEYMFKEEKIKYLLSILTRRCEKCGKWKAYIEHSNCSYVDELSNYNYCCKECHKEINTMYQEWWDDYYSSIY